MSYKQTLCDRCSCVIEKGKDIQIIEVNDGTHIICCPTCKCQFYNKSNTHEQSWKYYYSCDL